MKNKEAQIIRQFMVFFDGVAHYVDPEVDISTYQMGLCDLKLIDKGLKVTLRRPGLLIGKGGKTINQLKKVLGCDVIIEEKEFFNPQ